MGYKKHRQPVILPNKNGEMTEVTHSFDGQERDTGEVFINGERVFTKTIQYAGDLVAGPASTAILHGITGMTKLLQIVGSCDRANGDFINLPFVATDINWVVQVKVTPTTVWLSPGTAWTAVGDQLLSDAVLTLYYLK